MVGFKHTLCALVLTILTGVTVAQNNTNSPYTRYGYGNLSNQNFGNSKAMGGIAYGLRDGSQINPLNPASYTAIDSLTFLFEGGFSVQNTNMSLGETKLNAKNSSLDYVAMQFRMRKWLAMSIGLLPYSNVGYTVSQMSAATSESPNTMKMFSGDGGLHQLYAGLGVKVLKNLSLGANISYLWGDIQRDAELSFLDNSSATAYREGTHLSVSDIKLDFGLQYTQHFGKKHEVTLGATFAPKQSLNNETNVVRGQWLETTNNAYYVSSSVVDSVATSGLPNCFGFGFTYTYDKRLTIGADYNLQKWGDVTYINQPNAFCDLTKIAVGAEYLPDHLGRSYLSHVKYRLGAYYTTPYYKLEGSNERASREYGVTAGFGLPVPRTRSIISVTAQYVRVEGLVPTAVNENILRLSIGLTFNERWFFKRKVD